MPHRAKDEATSVLPPDPQVEKEGATGQMAGLEAELAHARDQIRRTLADLENYRKRFDRELERLREQDREALLRDLLPVVDNLERALASTTGGGHISRAGVEAVHRQLLAVLKRYGVEPTEDEGRRFDPLWHEVVATTQSSAEEGTIAAVAERGYRQGERPLRPARVVVAKPGADRELE